LIRYANRHALVVVLDINNGALELPGRYLTVEQNVNFTVRAVLELGQEEVGHDPAENSGASPDVTTLARQIPPGWVQHLRGQEDHWNLGNIVRGTADTSAQSAETDGRCLGNNGIGDRSEGAGVHERNNNTQAGLRVVGLVVLGDRGNDGEDEEERDVGGRAPEVDGSTAEPGSKRPREGVGNEAKARVDQVELESTVASNTSL
jgi:hypothetical protein